MGFQGFPRRMRSIPAPSPLFGPLLEEIDDLAELKCTLRVVWLLHEKRGFPRYLTLSELKADRTLVSALNAIQAGETRTLEDVLDRAVQRGTLAAGAAALGDRTETLYVLNTEAGRKALAGVSGNRGDAGVVPVPEPWEGPEHNPSIFALYEDNVGMLSPMIADELREAEELYPQAWIQEAFREAVAQNKRSWRYISAILQRWEHEGRSDGKPGRHSKRPSYY